MNMLRDLNYSGKVRGKDIVPVTKESLYREMCIYDQNKAECEMVRTNEVEVEKLDFIEYAHQRDKYL